jgi:lipoprotein-releasing system permease protein
MYKYLLCWRYLCTRYIALASIVSVVLGVTTMIVVNGVMAGFGERMRDRLHGVLADVLVESYDLNGFYDVDEVIARIEAAARGQIAALAPTAETFGLISFQVNHQPLTRQVLILGIRPEQRAGTGEFAEFLFNDRDQRIGPSLAVPEVLRQPTGARALLKETGDPFEPILKPELEAEPDHGAIIGYALAAIHRPGMKADQFIAPPGTQINLVFPKGGKRPEPAYDSFTTIGYFKSGMSEYDASTSRSSGFRKCACSKTSEAGWR